MTNKNKYGTLGTIRQADKKKNSAKPAKEAQVRMKMQTLLNAQRMRLLPHASQRMAQRGVIYYEVLQALSNAQHEPSKDRFSDEHQTWEYSFVGLTCDERRLRIAASFEKAQRLSEVLLIVTVIDLDSEG